MSSLPVFTVQHGRLDTEEDLQQTLGLKEGQKLFVVSSNDEDIVLRRSNEQTIHAPKPDWRVAFENLRALYKPSVAWTPEWHEKAEQRRQAAISNLDRVYADPASGATEIKNAERELEFASDDLKGGPYPEP